MNTRLSAVDSGRAGKHHGDVASSAGGSVHDAGGDRGVGHVRDDGAASATHGIRRALTLHDLRAAGSGAALLELLLADLALGEEAQQLIDGGLGRLAGFLDAGRQLGESTGDVASREHADGNALQHKTRKSKNQVTIMQRICSCKTENILFDNLA